MSHELCQCGQEAGCTDPDTEARREQFLRDLNRATEQPPVPVNRIRWVLTTSTATSTINTMRYEP